MKATRPISQGEEIFNDYGPLPRSDLLRMYGYITDNYAQYDVVEISYDLLIEVAGKKHEKNNTTWLKREQQLDELGLLDDGYAIPRPEQGLSTDLHDAIPAEVHMLLRALCARDEDGGAALKKPKDPVTVEEAALLQSVLIKRLSEYSTSYEDDLTTLDKFKQTQTASDGSETPDAKSSKRFSMALQVRLGEKEILQQLISICQEYIRLRSEELAFNRSSKRKHDEDSTHQSKKIVRNDEKHRR